MSAHSDEEDLLSGFEERADHVTEDVLRDRTVTGDYFDAVHAALVAQGLVLVQGPRGCGKTHMMRYTWLQCRDQQRLPLAIYVSFNRYLRLEPLLQKRPDALTLFQVWTLSRILLAADELSAQLPGTRFDIFGHLELDRTSVERLVTRLERNVPVSITDDSIVQSVTIESTAAAIEVMCDHYKRRRAILLLDDAALTLTEDYLREFLEIVRVIKRSRVSPKASVYPGTTQYSHSFATIHEGKTVTAWLPIEHDDYQGVMRAIAEKRLPESSTTPPDVRDLLMYAAFGVPRAYLAMLREWSAGGFASEQQGVNRIIQSHNAGRREEFRALMLKVPRFSTLVETGENFFDRIVEALRDANESLADKNERVEKQLLFGLENSNISPLVERMIKLLIEAGLVYEQTQVSHGPDRTYRRLTPHLAALIAVRAFSSKSRGSSPKQIVEFLKRPATKHPVRRAIEKVLDKDILDRLKLDLPVCQNCKTPRVNENQKFCHECGHKLIDNSTFTTCMEISFDKVPHLTDWARKQLTDHNIKKIGDLLSLQDPGTELRKIYMVGPTRAGRIVTAVESYVDEFLS